MARVALGFAVVGLVFAGAGVVVAAAVGDRYLGLALLLVGVFLIVLPLTRPHVEE